MSRAAILALPASTIVSPLPLPIKYRRLKHVEIQPGVSAVRAKAKRPDPNAVRGWEIGVKIVYSWLSPATDWRGRARSDLTEASEKTWAGRNGYDEG